MKADVMSLDENEGAVVRPLKVLTELIKEDFEAAEQAGMEYYKAAGEKLIEVRECHFEGDSGGFFKWAERTFRKKPTQIRGYMAYADAQPSKALKSLRKFKQEELGHTHDTGRVRREWAAPIDAIAEKARADARRLALNDTMTKRQEREAESKLGLRLIDIGYKVLALELHPDKVGGSREAMTRLNRVRDRLKANV